MTGTPAIRLAKTIGSNFGIAESAPSPPVGAERLA